MECPNKKCVRSANCGILDITGKIPQGSCSYFKDNRGEHRQEDSLKEGIKKE